MAKKRTKKYTNTTANNSFFLIWLILGLVAILCGVLAVSNAKIMNVLNNFATTSKAATVTSPNPICDADINHDGVVDIVDFGILSGDTTQKTYPQNIRVRSDLNFDSTVNKNDLSLIQASFGKMCNEGPVCGADINHDGVVDTVDFAMLRQNLNQTCSHGENSACRSDINSDSVVNSKDADLLQASFGQKCSLNPICAADVNHDGVVDSTDYSRVLYDYNNSTCKTGTNCNTDINSNGIVDKTDLQLIKASFGQICPSI